MRILVDQDDVLAQWWPRMVEWYNQDNGTNLTVDDMKSWNVHENFGHDAKYFLRACTRYPDFYRDLDPVPGAIEGMKTLIDKGHDVIICTAVPPFAGIAYHGKLEWIRRNMPFFNLKNFIAVQRKDLISGDILFDDGPHNAEPFARTGRDVYLLNAPWNRAFKYKRTTLAWGNVIRVDGWKQFIDEIHTPSF